MSRRSVAHWLAGEWGAAVPCGSRERTFWCEQAERELSAIDPPPEGWRWRVTIEPSTFADMPHLSCALVPFEGRRR